jgi:hypothetical protein
MDSLPEGHGAPSRRKPRTGGRLHEWFLVVLTAALVWATFGLGNATHHLTAATQQLADIESARDKTSFSLIALSADFSSRQWQVVIANTGPRDLGITSISAGVLGETFSHNTPGNGNALGPGDIRTINFPILPDVLTSLQSACSRDHSTTAMVFLNATSGPPISRTFQRSCDSTTSSIDFYVEGVNLQGR